MLAQYRKLSVPLLGDGTPMEREAAERRREARRRARWQRERLRMEMRRNINDNLPKNVPW